MNKILGCLEFSYKIAAVLLLVLVSGCTRTTTSGSLGANNNAIVGGSVVSSSDPIALVAVKILITHADGRPGGCSGTIISGHSVLTAAHCVGHGNQLQAVAFVDGITYPVRAVHVHPSFGPASNPLAFDFAVVDFESPAPVATTAILSDEQSDPRVGQIGFSAGFGITSSSATDFGTLRKVQVNVTDAHFSDSQIEVKGEGPTGVCHGDSGGPGYTLSGSQVVIWGTASANSPRAIQECLGFEVYGKVSSARAWILSQAAN